jgi:surfeit locus 1 family protein
MLKSRRDLAVLLAALIGVALTLALARWQWGRAQQKLAIAAQQAERAAWPAIDNAALLRLPTQQLLWRPAELTGIWQPQFALYLDNRQMDGRPGFYLVMPLRLAGSASSILVQRGWVPRDPVERTHVPAVRAPAGTVRLRGLITPPPGRLYSFAADERGPIRQNVDIAAYARETGLPMLDVSLREEAQAQADGLARRWPAFDAGADRNFGYALQWLSLSILIAGLYVWYQWLRPCLRRERGAA